jgi:hypothetical protein
MKCSCCKGKNAYILLECFKIPGNNVCPECKEDKSAAIKVAKREVFDKKIKDKKRKEQKDQEKSHNKKGFYY